MRAFTRRDAMVLAALLAAFVASRVAWLMWNPGSASYWEESYRWIAPDLWRSGVTDSWQDLQADHYQGGSLVMIALAAGAFAAFGASAFALKLGAVVWSSLTLALLFETLRRHFGRRAATIAASAYVAGPPLLAYWGLCAMGSHAESLLFSLLQLLAFLGILSGEWRSPRGFFAFGAACGLGVWFCFTAGLSALACALTFALLERALPRRREALAALLGAAAGLLPWLAYNATHDFAGLDRVLQLFGLRPQIDPWPSQGLLDKAMELFAHVLPTALLDPAATFSAPRGIPLALTIAFAGLSVPALLAALERVPAAFAAGAREEDRREARLELVFLVYPAVFLAVYLASRYAVDVPGPLAFRIFTPFGALLAVPMAISFARTIDQGGRAAIAGRAACGVWLAALAAATFLFAGREPDGNSEVSEAMGYRTFGVLLHRKHAPDVSAALAVARRVPDPELRGLTRFGIGWGMQNRHEMGAPISEVEAVLATLPEDERADVVSGLRWTLHMRPAALRLRRLQVSDTPEVRAQLERAEALAALLDELAPQPEADPAAR